MDISLTEERAYHYDPQFNPEVARDRVEQKKVQLMAGTMGSLFGQIKPEDIQFIGMENRLEPYWLVTISSRTVYDRSRKYTVPVSGAEVNSVSVLGQEIPVEMKDKQNSFTMDAIEHCQQSMRISRAFMGVQGVPTDPEKYNPFANPEQSIFEVVVPSYKWQLNKTLPVISRTSNPVLPVNIVFALTWNTPLLGFGEILIILLVSTFSFTPR